LERIFLFGESNALLKEGPVERSEPPPKVVFRYNPRISNKKFKKAWIKTHTSFSGLANARKVKVLVKSAHVVFLEKHVKSLYKLSNAIDRIRLKVTSITLQADFRPGRLPVSLAEKVGAVKKHSPKYGRPLAAKVQVVNQDPYLRVIGGLTYSIKSTTVPPPKGKDKYWYFYRKRRRWHASEHHPYGDEPYYAVMA